MTGGARDVGPRGSGSGEGDTAPERLQQFQGDPGAQPRLCKTHKRWQSMSSEMVHVTAQVILFFLFFFFDPGSWHTCDKSAPRLCFQFFKGDSTAQFNREELWCLFVCVCVCVRDKTHTTQHSHSSNHLLHFFIL